MKQFNTELNEQRPMFQDTPNEFAYTDFKKWAYPKRGMIKKALLKALEDNRGDGTYLFLALRKIWEEWAKKKAKQWSNIPIGGHPVGVKFGRHLAILMKKDNFIIARAGNMLTKLEGANEAYEPPRKKDGSVDWEKIENDPKNLHKNPKKGFHSKTINKNDIQVLALDYLKGTGVLHKISRKAYQAWLKTLKSSYNSKAAAESIMNLVSDAGLLSRISKSKHQKWMKDMLGEGKLTEESAMKAIINAKKGAKASGGGYSSWTKIGNNSWKNKKTGRLSHDAGLYDRIGEFSDFVIEGVNEATIMTRAKMNYTNFSTLWKNLKKYPIQKPARGMANAAKSGAVIHFGGQPNSGQTWAKRVAGGKWIRTDMNGPNYPNEYAEVISSNDLDKKMQQQSKVQIKEGKLNERLARGLKPLLQAGSTITKNAGEAALIKLSDKFDRIDDEYAGEIASWLDMAIELMQDGYKGDATKN
jgi:hypothetical protein